jgi:hypothetical protein
MDTGFGKEEKDKGHFGRYGGHEILSVILF